MRWCTMYENRMAYLHGKVHQLSLQTEIIYTVSLATISFCSVSVSAVRCWTSCVTWLLKASPSCSVSTANDKNSQFMNYCINQAALSNCAKSYVIWRFCWVKYGLNWHWQWRVGKKDNKRTGVWWLTKEGCSQANVWVNALCFLQCYDTDE